MGANNATLLDIGAGAELTDAQILYDLDDET